MFCWASGEWRGVGRSVQKIEADTSALPQVTKSNEEVERIKEYPGGIRAILSQVGVKPVSDFTVASTGTEGGGQ